VYLEKDAMPSIQVRKRLKRYTAQTTSRDIREMCVYHKVPRGRVCVRAARPPRPSDIHAHTRNAKQCVRTRHARTTLRQCQVCARGPRAHHSIHRRSSQQTAAPHVAVCRHHVPLAVTRGQRQVYTIRAMQASPMASAACGPPPPPPRLQMRSRSEFAHANAGESPGPVSTVSSGWAAVSSLSL